MINVMYEDYKAKINELEKVINSFKMEIDEMKAPPHAHIPITIPVDHTRAKVLEPSTGHTTIPKPCSKKRPNIEEMILIMFLLAPMTTSFNIKVDSILYLIPETTTVSLNMLAI
ncbi:hypothetical protein HOY80DRAFT_1059391 [Tuber brumale]|nr:hypothetical protein HOY80DRAFT_1059391 [Tuber brumale]